MVVVALEVVRVDEPARIPPQALELLDGSERRAAARFRRPADAARYVLAHATLRRAVAARTGTAPAGVSFGRSPCPLCGGPHGRPVVATGGVEISLTHTEGLVAVALAPAGIAVGVDAEPAGRDVDPADLLHPREPAADPLGTWVRKEAYLKGTGSGLGVDPTTVDLSSGPPAGWVVRAVDVGPAHRAAVAVAAPTVVVEVAHSSSPGGLSAWRQ